MKLGQQSQKLCNKARKPGNEVHRIDPKGAGEETRVAFSKAYGPPTLTSIDE